MMERVHSHAIYINYYDTIFGIRILKSDEQCQNSCRVSDAQVAFYSQQQNYLLSPTTFSYLDLESDPLLHATN